MAESRTVLLVVILLAAVGLFIVTWSHLVRRRRADKSPPTSQKATGTVDIGDAHAGQSGRETESETPRRASIVEHLDAIERSTERQKREIVIFMADFKSWQALGTQFSNLLASQVHHLKILAERYHRMLSAEEALFHTGEAYRLSRLMLALYGDIVAESDIVAEVLDDWFRSNHGVSTREFQRRVNIDCCRILLLDLDYASPPREIALRQLDLAEAHCRTASFPNETDPGPASILMSEISLRRGRLEATPTPCP